MNWNWYWFWTIVGVVFVSLIIATIFVLDIFLLTSRLIKFLYHLLHRFYKNNTVKSI